MFQALTSLLLGFFSFAWLRLPALPRGPFVTTRSGARWYPFTPRPEDVVIEDLGACAHINRFGGHAGLCSVAEHGVRVARLLARAGCDACVQLQGLLHDCDEVYYPGDVPGPVLKTRWGWLARWLVRRRERAVRTRLGLPVTLAPEVLWADREELRIEAANRLPAADWIGKPTPPRRPDRWEPEFAEYMFWSLGAVLADRVADQLVLQTCATGRKTLAESWDRIARLRAFAMVARREADRLQPSMGVAA